MHVNLLTGNPNASEFTFDDYLSTLRSQLAAAGHMVSTLNAARPGSSILHGLLGLLGSAGR